MWREDSIAILIHSEITKILRRGQAEARGIDTQLPAEAVAMEKCKRKTKDYHQKLNVRVASQIAEQFRTYDLRKLGTFKAVYLSFHWFNDS